MCAFYFVCRYNNLFRFLLKVKRTQLDLQQVWAAYMGTKHLSTAQLSNMTKIWLARMHMAFLVDNLQYYLQVSNLRDIFNNFSTKRMVKIDRGFIVMQFFLAKFKLIYFRTFGDSSCCLLTQHLGLSCP